MASYLYCRAAVFALCASLGFFALPQATEAQERAVHVKRLRAADYEAHSFVPPPAAFSKAPLARTAEIQVTFSTDAPAEVRNAFEFAASIWETLVDSPEPILVEAAWEPLEEDVLGSAGPQLIANFSGAPIRDTWYPTPLAEALAGTNFTGSDADIFASFNSDLGLWYFGTDDRVPTGRYSFATVVLHELGHGLGFTGSLIVDDGTDTGGDECPGAGEDFGCWGLGPQGYPIVFDRFTQDDQDVDLLNTQVYENPSLDLGDVLQSGSVFFTGTTAQAANLDIPVDLYAPDNFEAGSSYSHLDERIFPAGDLNSLMTPQLARSEAIFSPGPITCGIFADIGWTLGEGCQALLELGLFSFDVVAEGDDVVVEWIAFNANLTDRFEVQRRYFDDPFETIAEVPGDAAVEPPGTFAYAAESLTPGTYTFRLRQVMEDGRVFFSPEVTVFVEPEGSFFLSEVYPSPFANRASLYLLVEQRQDVYVAVYDIRGKRVQILFNGELPARERLPLTLDATGLASGVYFIRIRTPNFVETRSAVLVR